MSGSEIVLVTRNKGDRRSGVDRRQFSYTGYIPERRSGHDRRSGLDRRKKTIFPSGTVH